MANNKISCSTGKTNLVDPNNFSGNFNDNNVSVPLEDLNIYVELTTYKRNRTVLSANNTITRNESSDSVSINFIEGTTINGNKYLTTKFTDLTTSFDKDSDSSELLGISSIDIDFNSQYAPMIVIKFIDVRGSAIFQNDENITTNKNKYATFFQLPYPLYELTVKGYYGKPVKYTLHMTKFNSKFNSQNGNFEITAQFIGYTYAMLSDMLLGYLKAIPYTQVGANRYKKINSERTTPILNLNELMVNISTINTEIKKIAADDVAAVNINSSQEKTKILESIQNDIIFLGRESDIKNDLNQYNYIFFTGEINQSAIRKYNESIKEKINKFNEGNSNTLDYIKFVSFVDSMIVNLKPSELTDENFVNLISKLNTNSGDIEDKVLDLKYEIQIRGDFSSMVNIYDLTEVNAMIGEKMDFFTKKEDDSKIALAQKIKTTISERIGFEPTIRSIVEIFTTAVEVFLGSIYDVSEQAKLSTDRDKILRTKFGDNVLKTTDLVSSDSIHPWPDYREKFLKTGYVEKYLGSPGVLKTSEIGKVNELNFIDDLLNAFLKAEQISDISDELLANLEKNWIPINPVDTRLYIDSFPYSRIQALTKDDVLQFMLIRGMIFMGYTNSPSSITNDEIIAMANNEGEMINRSVLDRITKDALKNTDIIELETAKSNLSFLPESKLNSYLNNNDLYIDIISPTTYAQFASNEIDTSIDTSIKPTDIIGLDNKVIQSNVGFSTFGGSYGIQEFRDSNFESPIGSYVTKYSFYQNSKQQGFGFNQNKTRTLNKSNGVSKFDLVDNNNISRGTFTVFSDSDMFYKTVNGGIGQFQDSDLKLHNDFGLNLNLLQKLDTSITNITFPYLNYKVNNSNRYLTENIEFFSLFGSRFYYGQTNNYSKAFLFLNTIPWNGSPFNEYEILNLFAQKGGFIHAPKLWCAYVGGILWRMDSSSSIMDNDGLIIGGGSGANDPIVWKVGNQFIAPSLYIASGFQSRVPTRDEDINIIDGYTNNYEKYHILFKNLPDEVKDKFKNSFFEFVNNGDSTIMTSWEGLKSRLEIWGGTFDGFISTTNFIYSKIITNDDNYTLNIENLSALNNMDNYSIISPIKNAERYNEKNLVLSLKGDYNSDVTLNRGNVVKGLIDAIREEVIIVNTGYAIWNNTSETQTDTSLIQILSVPQTSFDLYFKTLLEKLNTNTFSNNEQTKQDEEEIFGTSNENIIKLQLYRTCKNTYDKWVGGATNGDDITFKTGNGLSNRNNLDKLTAQNVGGSTIPRLIDSFRFVTRSFKDIGDDLFINPTPVYEYLRNNPNANFYDTVTSLLTSNNFTFNALPTFIDYNDPKTVESMFDTVQYADALDSGISGPSFVCVYLGQSSKHLDFNDSEYNNDGFDFKCDGGNINNIPDDFTSVGEPYEDKVTVFSVNFGQQNQNIFKDVNLDQSEFGETAESLLIVDDITKNGSENNRSFGGQNIYNVYSVRSYKAEIEMMGNAMIQPMTYFQLNNIPMFHGAYMITRVKHSIIPNYMSTTFSGVRIREPESKIYDAADLYMSLIDSLDLSKSSSGTRRGDSTKTITSGELNRQQGFVDYLVKERPSLVYQEKSNGVLGKGDSYAMTEVGQFMEQLADKWYKANQFSTTRPNKLYINSFGGYGGKTNKKHTDNSLHYVGRAVDLRPMVKGTGGDTTVVNASNYNKLANIEFIQMAIDLHEKSTSVKIDNIILNDSDIIEYFKKYGNLVISSPGHNNHIHIEFTLPDRVSKLINEQQLNDSTLLTSGVKGAIVKNNANYPDYKTVLAAVGKINK